MRDVFVVETSGKSFVLFNSQPLTDEPIGDEDLSFCKAHGEEMKSARSAAWSSNCVWFFVVLSTGIALINVEKFSGVFCRKKSWKFIEAYLNARVRFD